MAESDLTPLNWDILRLIAVHGLIRVDFLGGRPAAVARQDEYWIDPREPEVTSRGIVAPKGAKLFRHAGIEKLHRRALIVVDDQDGERWRSVTVTPKGTAAIEKEDARIARRHRQ